MSMIHGGGFPLDRHCGRRPVRAESSDAAVAGARPPSKDLRLGARFIAALPHGLPTCLILDLHMPGMSGFELLQHLRRNGIQIPTIIMTAYGDSGVRKRCESAGAIAYLSKPVQDASLLAAIDEAGQAHDKCQAWAIGRLILVKVSGRSRGGTARRSACALACGRSKAPQVRPRIAMC